MSEYDYLVVGAGLFGAVFAHEAKKRNKKVLVIDKRPHIAGNIYTENLENINIHKYGAHIFHTNDKNVWEYVQQFSEFNRFTNSPIANFRGEIFSLPFNMYTFNKLWGVVTPDEAKRVIESQKQSCNISDISNLEQQAISLVGKDIYEKLIKGYTEKQWGRKCKDLPAFIIRRIPVRFNYDNNYFDALYQGIPIGGYTQMVERMLRDIEVRLNSDFLKSRNEFTNIAQKIVYTGEIDGFFDYRYGHLEYRSVRFETMVLNTDNYQGNAVVNYTSEDVPWTRIIEHKWFEFGKDIDGKSIPNTVISKEYSSEWDPSKEPYYPVNDQKNNEVFQKYIELANENHNVIFGGRLGQYQYLDMDKVIGNALSLANSEFL